MSDSSDNPGVHTSPQPQKSGWVTAILALSAAAYLPAQFLPFISDDYLQIDLGRHYGPIAAWGELAQDPLYRCRATSIVLTYWTDKLFGLNPVPYNLSSLALHLLNVWLVYQLGRWRLVGRRAALFGAAFFGIQFAPQEAVIWYAAVPELLMFLFALLAVHAWLAWREQGGGLLYLANIVFLALALLSKESAVAIVPLLGVLAWMDGSRWRLVFRWLAPHALLAAGYTALTLFSAPWHGHFHDAGTFSLTAPFWRTWLWSQWRLFLIWGWVAVLALAFWRPADLRKTVWVGAAWAAIALLPYCFLTYMPFVPSRHTYFASAGEALIVGAAFEEFRRRMEARRWAVVALAFVVIGHQYAYLWTRKLEQYRQRAANTERLVDQARTMKDPVYVYCYPDGYQVAELALKFRLGKRSIRLDCGAERSGLDPQRVITITASSSP